MSLKPFETLGALPEAFVVLVFGLGAWSFYGFPHLMEVALGCIAIGIIGAFLWKRSREHRAD